MRNDEGARWYFHLAPSVVKEDKQMAFPLPTGLQVSYQADLVSSQVTALEQTLVPGQRVLIALQIEGGLYSGIENDIAAEEAILQVTDGLYPWPEYPQFLTLDPNGDPIVWLSYLEGDITYAPQGWWLIIGAIALLPILAILPVFLIDLIAPGFIEGMMNMVMLMVMMMIMMPMMRSLQAPAEERSR